MTTMEAPLVGRACGVAMRHDIKELIGILMRVLDHAEITEAEVLDLEFDAGGELLAALNEAYIALLEFVHDHDLRMAHRDLDRRERSVLQDLLNKIVQLCDDTHT
jgi:ABC-type sulfate transport system substrate-binding protein